MFRALLRAIFYLFATVTVVQAICNFPPRLGPLPNNILEGFAIQVQNTSYPAIHNRFMSLWEVENGDQYPYLDPAGTPTSNLTLVSGVLTLLQNSAVINGEYTPSDNTTEMFMTQLNDPQAIFGVNYGCNQTDGFLQKELTFEARGTLLGGHICVRLASGSRYEFRYSPPENPATESLCIRVTLAIVDPNKQ